jgi:hypothetical protein
MRVKCHDGKCESVWRGTRNLCDGFSSGKIKRFVNPHELRWSRRAELPSKREPEIDIGSQKRSHMGHSQVTHSTQAFCHKSIYYIFIGSLFNTSSNFLYLRHI